MTKVKPFAINEPLYQWAVKAFSVLRHRLGMKINTYDEANGLADGQIFLFNHFARFETVIPQYFIHQATGAYCRCVATHELFEGSDRFAKVLWSFGAVPNNHPGLLPFLAAEILRGRKVIIFPEGSMMKDRSVAAPPRQGLLSSWSSYSGHRQGAAALAVTLELFKKRILSVYEEGDTARLLRWVEALGLSGQAELIAAAKKPTLVVPSNITFFPIRTEENILRKAAEFFHVDLGRKGAEELLIEGNLILRHTDMDIRFGTPLHPDLAWTAADRVVLKQMFEQIDDLNELFGLKDSANRWLDRMAATSVKRATRRLRDLCMVEMYSRVTLNLNHLASRLLLRLAESGATVIDKAQFGALLYRIVKDVQRQPGLHLHRTLTEVEGYSGLHNGHLAPLKQFLETAEQANLLLVTSSRIELLPSLTRLADEHDPRVENSIRVYANEISSLTAVTSLVERAVAEQGKALAQSLFDDEWRSFLAARKQFADAKYAAVNNLETASQSGEPFLLMPAQATKPGIVLVHGLLASPAEMRSFGKHLASLGHPVMGVRLAGHGTSPWDLKAKSWQDWLNSVKRGYEIMALASDRVILLGVGSGAALALHLAALRPKGLAAVISVSAPLKLRQRYPRFTPLMDGLSKLASLVRMQDGVKPFLFGEPQHPDIDYCHMPYATLVQLQRMADELQLMLPRITAPAVIMQGSGDPVVSPESATMIERLIGSEEKTLHIVPSQRHGILYEDIAGTQAIILKALQAYGGGVLPVVTVKPVLMARVKAALASILTVWNERARRGHAS